MVILRYIKAFTNFAVSMSGPLCDMCMHQNQCTLGFKRLHWHQTPQTTRFVYLSLMLLSVTVEPKVFSLLSIVSALLAFSSPLAACVLASRPGRRAERAIVLLYSFVKTQRSPPSSSPHFSSERNENYAVARMDLSPTLLRPVFLSRPMRETVFAGPNSLTFTDLIQV